MNITFIIYNASFIMCVIFLSVCPSSQELFAANYQIEQRVVYDCYYKATDPQAWGRLYQRRLSR